MSRRQGARQTSSATAVFAAIQHGDLERVRSLLDDEPVLANAANEHGLSPLMVATYWRRPAIVDLLLGRGAPDDIFAASARGDLLAVDVLLDAEPDAVNHHSVDGWTPLALAAHFGSADVAQHLLASGADVKAISRNALANSPLHAAVAGNQPELTDLLLQHGADPNITDANGWTSLAIAAHDGRIDLAQRLLAGGADPAITNPSGQTAAKLAREQGHHELAALLDGAMRGTNR